MTSCRPSVNKKAPLLTPDNEIAFLHTLFDMEEVLLAEYHSLVSTKPLFRSTFDGYAERIALVRDNLVGALSKTRHKSRRMSSTSSKPTDMRNSPSPANSR